jgi:ubiquinone/menaquinone biosynthesis C-methylase UbiE
MPRIETYNSDLVKIEEYVELNGKALLEVGCGEGRLTAILADKSATVIAVDPDGAKIDAARKKLTNATFLVGSGEKLFFATGTFDIVLFSYSLHHQNCAKALAEAKGILRKEGCILIIDPTDDGEFTRFVSVFEKDEIDRIRETRTYLRSNRIKVLQQDVYYVAYPYKDEYELYGYFMENFMIAPDDRAVRKMEFILGDKKNDRPIIIKDKVAIYLIGN